MNDEMLALARKYQPEIIAEVGYDNVEFRKGRIHDLSFDRDLLDAWLRDNPVNDELSLRRMEETVTRFRQEQLALRYPKFQHRLFMLHWPPILVTLQLNLKCIPLSALLNITESQQPLLVRMLA